MSDAAAADGGPPTRATTAGSLLRQARQAQGVHIAALAAMIKVAPRKLELLEADRHDELPDAAFARALAQSVCRQLKVDAAPVLALLPPLGTPQRLERVAQGLNTPFREAHEGFAGAALEGIATPALWLAGALVAGAVLIYLLPSRWLPFGRPAAETVAVEMPPGGASGVAAAPLAPPERAPAPPPRAAAPADAAPPPEAAAAPAAAAPAASAAADATPAAAPAAGAALKVDAKARSWLEIVDANGQVLIARVLDAGESVAFDVAAPMRVTIGNAGATTVALRGEPVDFATATRGNVARFTLK